MDNGGKKHFWLYILLLEEHKYYIGITTKTPEERFKEHQNGFMAARWTKKYKPIKIIDRKDLGLKTLEEAELFESRAVRKYMQEKGYNNARGGDLTDEKNYTKRFGRFFIVDDWETITVVVFLVFCLIVMTIMYYTKS